MNAEQIFQLPIKRAVFNILAFCLFLSGISVGSILIANTMENAGFRILLIILGILFLLPIFYFILLLFQITRSKYLIDREGLTIIWGLQKMVIPLNEIEWIRPYDQMGYSIPLPALAKLGIFSGRLFTPELGEVLFFATRQQDAYLIGTKQEMVFISPANPGAFQKGLQEAIYLGSITPPQRKSISFDSPMKNIRANLGLYVPLSIGLLLTLILFILYGFLSSQRESIQIGTTRFEPASNLLLIPILSAVFNLLDIIISPVIYKKEALKPYAILLSYSGFFLSAFLILSILISLLSV